MSGSPSTPLVIVGAGGFARETAEIVRAINAVEPRWDLLGYVDDDPARWGQIVSGALVLGGTEVLDGTDAMAVVCVGNPTHFDVRARIVDRLGMSPDRYATLVHPTVSLASSTTIGEGTVIAAHCVTTTDVEIERHVAVMPACVFTHDVHIGSFATLASGVRLAGAVTVGSGAYVGSGALVREHCTIGARALVGMGSVVTRDIPDDDTWAGVPARRIRLARPGAGTSSIDSASAHETSMAAAR